jgi:hypothetical protein
VADIDVVKASRSSRAWIWWVIAAVAVALVVLMLTRTADDTRRAPAGSSHEVATATVAA